MSSNDYLATWRSIEHGARDAGVTVDAFLGTELGARLARTYNQQIRGVLEDASTEPARNLAWRMIEDEARKVMMAEPSLTFSECVDRVCATQPHLASAHLREMRG